MTVKTEDALKNVENPKFELVDDALNGFGSARKGVSGPIVKEKAIKLYEKLGGGGR